MRIPGIPNPWVLLAGVAVLLLALGGGYAWGHAAASASCAAAAGRINAKVKGIEDVRDAKVDAIAANTDQVTNVAVATNRGLTDESAERIRRLPAAPGCTPDPSVVRELSEARDAANAALGVALRSGAAGAHSPAR